MKKIAKFLIVLGMMGQLSSCDYLDIVPDERAQESDTWKTEGAVRGYLYSCYGYLPANRTFGNSYWLAEELTAVTKELFTTFKYGYYSPVYYLEWYSSMLHVPRKLETSVQRICNRRNEKTIFGRV